ncbi:major facilitator superfamily domain-containing protein [Cunninghamella echinulata]|nr:major facilitator superfamily domain-containing protein [Cunninghamella echinulata]
MTFIALQITLFLGALDGTIISPCLPKIGTEFNAASITVWVSTAYVLTFDSFQPIFSKLSDIFGRKWTLVASVGIFLVGSLLCGVAKTMIMLIISRAIAGIGAAGVFAGVFTIVSELIPLEKRGSYQGIINAVFAFASCVGPLIGGLLTDNATWRWAFFINLPIGGIAVLFIIFFFHETIPKASFMSKLKRIDYLGTILILISAILFLLALNMGGTMYPWKSAPVIAPLVLSLVFIIIFAVVECKYAVEPIFPPYIFKNQSCVAILLTNFFSGIYFFSVVFYLPNYYQVIKGDSAMWSGIRLLPFQLVISFFSTLAGILISKLATFRIFIWSGCFIITLDMGLLSILDVDTDFALIYGFLIIGSMGKFIF